MRDLDIRAALHDELSALHRHDPNTLVIHELGLCEGLVRVDLAVVNGALAGYEIKSERDTLDRLPAQEAVYSRAFDIVTIVADREHLERVRDMIPSWWGIMVAEPERADAEARPARVVLSEVRPASVNPNVDATAVVQLLWRDEALAILRARGADRGVRTKPRSALWARLTETVPLQDLQALVRAALRARESWRAGSPPTSDGATCRPSATSSRSPVRRRPARSR